MAEELTRMSDPIIDDTEENEILFLSPQDLFKAVLKREIRRCCL
jgi:hypothetical protein